MQNLVILMEPNEDADEVSLKGGNMCLNRFSINEDAAFEISGVHYLKEWSFKITDTNTYRSTAKREAKG